MNDPGCTQNCKRCDDMHESLATAHNRINTKVSWWIIAALMGVFVATLGATYAKTADISERVAIIQTEIKHLRK